MSIDLFYHLLLKVVVVEHKRYIYGYQEISECIITERINICSEKEAVNCPNPNAVDSAKMQPSVPYCRLQSCSPVHVLKHLLFQYLLLCRLQFCHLTLFYACQVVVQCFSQNSS